MCSFIQVKAHNIHITTLYKRNAQQYKGRGNSLQYESARINILYNFSTFTKYRLSPWETPNLYLAKFPTSANSVAQLVGTSVRSPHDSPTLLFTSSHDHVVCPTRARLQVATHGRLCPRHTSVHNLNTSPSHRAHLHTGRELTLATQEPVPSRCTNQAPHTRARLHSTTERSCLHLHPQPR